MAADILPTPPSMMAFVAAAAAAATAAAATPAAAGGRAEAEPVEVNPNAAPIEAPKEIKPETRSTPTSSAARRRGWCARRCRRWRRRWHCPRRRRRRRRRRHRSRFASAATSSRRTKTKDVAPVYPPIAQSARVQGVVIIEAMIGPNGKVQDARVLRSIPLLDQAALDAVRQWEFTPTLLNGVPVPVIMTVTVQFTLS